MDDTFPIGVHPFPVPAGTWEEVRRGAEDGPVWPSDLAPPFRLKEVLDLHVESWDGTMLRGWAFIPDLPDGVRAPTVVWTSPYFGQTQGTPNQAQIRDGDRIGEVPVDLLVEQGFAVAAFSSRGTGYSAGCFDAFGPSEQKDHGVVVEWLAEQPWSNGRIGMMGLSYDGTTPAMAAIQNPPHLKTIVVAGMVTDVYVHFSTPQGAVNIGGGPFWVQYSGMGPGLSPAVQGNREEYVAEWLPIAAERYCPELLAFLATFPSMPGQPTRDAQWWNDRRLIEHFPKITAAFFITEGFGDGFGTASSYAFADNAAWASAPNAPRRQMVGQWAHQFPNFNTFRPELGRVEDWNRTLVEWLDFWLKGLGDAPRLGVADYQDDTGAWHESSRWPPADARHEALYLVQGALAPEPGQGAVSFQTDPGGPAGPRGPTAALLCPPQGVASVAPSGVAFVSEPVQDPVLIAGNPFAFLRLSTDAPGGIVGVELLELTPEFSCAGGAAGAEFLSIGVADLRFHQGNFDARDFPTGIPTSVRIDLADFASVIEAGNRIAVVVHDPTAHAGQPFFPRVTVHGDGGAEASQVVLPVVQGTLGGQTPTLDYPPRPFLPAHVPWDWT